MRVFLMGGSMFSEFSSDWIVVRNRARPITADFDFDCDFDFEGRVTSDPNRPLAAESVSAKYSKRVYHYIDRPANPGTWVSWLHCVAAFGTGSVAPG